MLWSLLVFLWFVLCLVPYKKISSKKFARFIHGKERGMTITMKKNSRLSKSRQFILLEMVFFLHTGIIGAVYTLYLLSLGLSLFEANAISAIFNIAAIVFEVPSGAMCYKALNQYEDALSYLQIVHQADNSNELYIKEIKEIENL